MVCVELGPNGNPNEVDLITVGFVAVDKFYATVDYPVPTNFNV